MEKNVLAIVVTYNRSHMLSACLKALRGQTVPCHVLIIDNASTDDTMQIAAPFLNEQTDYRRMDKNLGGAGGFNAGMRIGTEEGYRYLWLMDDDVLPEPTALEELLAAAEILNGQFGFLSSVALWTDGKECRMNRQAVNKRFYEQAALLQHGLLTVRQATFVSCFVKSETVRRYGLPIAEFFIWGDDIEYTRRLAVREALPCYLAGKSIVVHHMASNSGSDISLESGERLQRYSYAYRNENYLYRQEGAKGILYYCARCGLHLWRILTQAKDHRLKRSGILLKAFFAGWFFNPKIEYIKEESLERAL